MNVVKKFSSVVLVSKKGVCARGEKPFSCKKYGKRFCLLISPKAIQKRVAALAKEIAVVSQEKIHLWVVLNGAFVFAADLMRELQKRYPQPLCLDFVSAASYGKKTRAGKLSLCLPKKTPKKVLLIEDILDSGQTLSKIQRILHKKRAQCLTCVLLKKRKKPKYSCKTDFVGFEIPNEFVVGYGLDYKGEYRGLPFVATLKT
jgi:hypoxanthine phosphoribosyltransferase